MTMQFLNYGATLCDMHNGFNDRLIAEKLGVEPDDIGEPTFMTIRTSEGSKFIEQLIRLKNDDPRYCYLNKMLVVMEYQHSEPGVVAAFSYDDTTLNFVRFLVAR